MSTEPPLLAVEDLQVHFPVQGTFLHEAPPVRAVDGLSFSLERGRTLGLVGESGCGKSTTGFAILQLIRPTGGRVLFHGTNIAGLSPRAMRPYRRRMQIIFQDAAASLDPRLPIAEQIAEPLEIHNLWKGRERQRRVRMLLDQVGLPSRVGERYPHEISGGQAQRVAIARAIAVEPELIICDEPVSALDVSIQAQILNLLQSLQRELGLAYVFISHDLAVVQHVCDEVAVMYLGRIAEMAPRRAIFETPSHPYSKALLSAVPIPDPDIERARERVILKGDLPSPADPPSGCRFRTRCPIAIEDCARIEPPARQVGPDHHAACIRV